MNSKVNYALVGFFVIVLSLVMIAVLLWLTVGTQQKDYERYQVYIQESVFGLNPKAPVNYRGVEVGRVANISIRPERPDEVYLVLEIEKGTPISESTQATLTTQGLTGLAQIELSGGTLNAPPPQLKEGELYPELESTPSLFMRFDLAISALLENLNSMSDIASNLLLNLNSLTYTANSLLSNENRQAINATLQNVEQMTAVALSTLTEGVSASEAGGLLTNAELTVSHLVTATEQLPAVLTQLETTLAAFEQTANTVNVVMNESQQDIQTTTKAVASLADTLNTSVQGSAKDVDNFTQQALPEITRVLQELRDALQNLRTLSRDLEQQPNAILFGKPKGKPGPGE